MLIGYDGSKIDWQRKTGTEQYASLLLQHLLKINHNHQIRIYTRSQQHQPPPSPRAQFCPITLPRLWTQVGLAQEVYRHPPDVLFIPAHTMPIIHRPSLKTVVTIHDLGYEYLPQYHQFPARLYLNRTTEFAAHHATHLIAVSNFTKRDMIQKLKVPANKITVVYEGVDRQQYHQPTADNRRRVLQKYSLNRPFVLFVGTIQPRKNLVRLIEAFAQIAPKHPDLQLVLAGGRGWLSDEIYAAPSHYGIGQRVSFLGYVDEADKPALYASAQLTALVSLFEGFGLPALESMACGTPALVANASSLPEVVGDAGLLVDPYSSEDIANGLHQLLIDQALRQQLVRAGNNQVTKFDWDAVAQQTLDVLERAAA